MCEIAHLLGPGVSVLSHQLGQVYERGAVDRRQAGRIVCYRLA